jgi:hypothetical protein
MSAEPPSHPDVLDRLPVDRATSPPPADRIPVETAFFTVAGQATPSITAGLTRVASGRSGSTWRLDVDVGGAEPAPGYAPAAQLRAVALPTRRRRRPSRTARPFRPPWADLEFHPKAVRPARRTTAMRHGDEELAPLSVFPPDLRQVYQLSTYPWRCVCRVSSGGALGSGVLIGPRHLLTASHVIDWAGKVVKVAANRFDSSTWGTAFAEWIYFDEKIGNVNTGNVEEDWVVCVLSNRLGDWTGWLGAREYDDDWDGEPYWHSIGYASDLGGTDRPVWQNQIKLNRRTAAVRSR